MKSVHHFVPVLAGIIGVTGAWGAIGIGCSSSSGGPTAEDGGGSGDAGDATTDANREASNAPDAPADVLAEGSADTGTAIEASADTGLAADADGGATEDSAASDADAGFPDADAAAPDPTLFAGYVATALCSVYASCCETSLDAATFNKALCLAEELPEGFHGSNLGTEFLDGGNVIYNASAAQLCISTLSSLGCMPDQITSAQDMALYQACLGAFTGKLMVGSPCQGSIECAPGSFCLPGGADAGEGGPIGLCEPLAGDGGACGVFGSTDTVVAQSACSYHGGAANGLFCQSFDAAAPLNKLDAAVWTCAPQESLGTGCYNGVDCTSRICDPGSLSCATATDLFTLTDCPQLLVDAGGGD